MPSDAHELAARLRDLVGALDWDAPKHITQDIDARVTAAAAELERLADENARLLNERDYWRSLHDNEQTMRREADAKIAVSAGPPQEAGDCICGEINARHCPVHNDPPPERRCTCQRVMLMGREIARPRDPACPEHGR